MLQVEHLLTENERITAKEGSQGGLTEGQQAQLTRNDKAITSVRLQASFICFCLVFFCSCFVGALLFWSFFVLFRAFHRFFVVRF